MTPSDPRTQPPQAADETEARRELERLKGGYRQEAQKATEHFKFLAKAARDRLEMATREAQDFRELKARLHPHRARPVQARDYYAASLLAGFYDAVAQALALELACYERNLRALGSLKIAPEVLEVPELPTLEAPEQDPRYQLATATSQVAQAFYFWEEHLEGLELAFRVAGQEGVVQIEAPEQEAAYQERAAALAAAAKGQPSVGMLVQQVASELGDLPGLLAWAEDRLDEAARMAPTELGPLVADPRWGKLARKSAFLAGLGERAAAHPELAPLFPHAGDAVLPFDAPTPPLAR